MKRSIPRSLVQKALEQTNEPKEGDYPKLETKSATGPLKGSGSAWKSGALAQSQAAIDESRAQLAKDVLNGRHGCSLCDVDRASSPCSGETFGSKLACDPGACGIT